jgi:type I restriction enzyme, S subunit
VTDLKVVAIGDCVRAVESWNPLKAAGEDEFTYIDLSAIDHERKQIVEARSVACVEAPSRARQLVEAGDVLVSTVRPNLNGVARVGVEHHGATASTGFCVLRPKAETLDGGYAFQWVKSPGFVADMVSRATGASYPAVSDRIIFDSRIPLPLLPEQRRIAAILDQADALRAKRREALAQLDSLAQSLFIEMFGDPMINPKGWPRRALAEIGKVITGNTPPRERQEYFGNYIEWIKSDNINSPSYYLTQATEGLSESGKRVGRTAPPLSILVTCIAGSPDCIGNSAMADREVAFNQQINAFVPARVDPHFAYVQMIVGKKLIQEASTNGMKGMVSKSRFEKIELMVPPLALQQTFATRIGAVESLKLTHCAALAESDALFDSLQHRAFAGQLS